MCNQRRDSIVGSILLSVLIFILFTGTPVYAQMPGPNEVIAYEHINFVGAHRSWKLEPGMRQKLVPYVGDDMNDRISSIEVGSKVAVMVFQDRDFGYIEGRRSHDLLRRSFPSLPCDSRGIFYDSMRWLGDFFNDKISSLIIFPKEWLQPIGVMVSDRGHFDNGDLFFPLPEALDQTETKYPTMPGMNDDANEVTLYPYDHNSPMYGKVQVTLFEHPNWKGRWVTLPGADGSIPPGTSFKLNAYQFDDIASSLMVRWVGPVMTPIVGTMIPAQIGPAAPERGTPADPSGVRVRAPVVVTLETNTNRPGMDYKNFWLASGPDVCQKACTDDVNCKAFTYVKAGVQGPTARCYLKSGVPKAVSNNNCVSGVKQ